MDQMFNDQQILSKGLAFHIKLCTYQRLSGIALILLIIDIDGICTVFYQKAPAGRGKIFKAVGRL